MSKSTVIKLDLQSMQNNRKGKADGYMPEVRRGNGVHIPKKHKKKFKEGWKKDAKSFY